VHFGSIARSQEVMDQSVCCEFKQGTGVSFLALSLCAASDAPAPPLTRPSPAAQSYKKPGEERTRGQLMNILISAAPGAHFEPIRGLVHLPSYTM